MRDSIPARARLPVRAFYAGNFQTCVAFLSENYNDQERFAIAKTLIDADTLGDFLRRSRRCGTSISFPDYVQAIFCVRVRHCEKSCDKIAQPDWLTLVAIRSDERKKSRERAHLANAGEFNRRYLTCQISAILYADRRPHLHVSVCFEERGI